MTPDVTLSPNAMKRVFCSLGAGVTFTRNPHVPTRPRASVEVQVTAVEPTGNEEPAAGRQPTVTGADPFVGTGAGYATDTGPSVADVRVMSAGQVS
jgi:hypothetical protein